MTDEYVLCCSVSTAYFVGASLENKFLLPCRGHLPQVSEVRLHPIAVLCPFTHVYVYCYVVTVHTCPSCKFTSLLPHLDNLELFSFWIPHLKVPSAAVSLKHGWGIYGVPWTLFPANHTDLQTIASTTHFRSPNFFWENLKLVLNGLLILPNGDLWLLTAKETFGLARCF